MNLKPRVYVSSGGGIRIGATWGSQLEGEKQNAFHYSMFDTFIGTSAGALDAALTANRWSAQQKLDLFFKTDFSRFFLPGGLHIMPFMLRKALSAVFPMSLKRLADWIDSLGLMPVSGMLTNTVNSLTNEHIVYCEDPPLWWPASSNIKLVTQAFSTLGFGTVLTRSMALPGLNADEPEFRDGGYAENPLLSILPSDSTGVMINLGYPGNAKWHGGKNYPVAALDQAMYYVEYKNYASTQHLIAHYQALKVIYPNIFDVDSTNFALSINDKRKIVKTSIQNTQSQW
ncbi:MAG: patatin-like phospholipase family protein [Cyanobacteria bacterium]|nr:patatin-like phospholipase family protein [Cyanobacteriota bacterium]